MQTVPTGWDREFTQTLMNYCYADVTLHLGDNDTLTFTKADMTSFEVSQSVSPINAELPQSSLRFSITTIDRDVRALQRSLTRMLKVTARVGITINGEPAYINAGTFWLDTWDFPNGGIEASFEARDALYFLSSEKYIYGVYRRNGISLYDLADEVLTYAQGRFPCVTTWSINNILSSSDTTAPLPVCTYAECLQYIAQASGTVLKYDRDGVIRFDLTSGDTSYNYIVTDTNCFAYPQLVMYPELRKLRCNVYTYSLDEIYSDTEHYPNVNGDATVSAVDAALVLSAAAKIGAGEPSGLTPEQEVKADADRDGMITAADAALIQEYAAKCGSGKYENTPDGWALFLNIKIGYKEKVYDSIHNIDEDMELVITYGTSAEVNVMKEGTITITNVDDYSNAAEITITGTDEDAQITAYGFPIEVSTHEYRRDVNESGDDEYIDNPLVTNNTTAGSATQDVKDFLSIRNGVECSDLRIDPRLDAGDTITVNIDGEDTTYGNTIVTDVKYRFTGMFRGAISGRISISEPEPTYDETKIAVIELDENDEPTGNVEYFDTISDAKSYLDSEPTGRFWLRIGTESGVTSIEANGLSYCTSIVIVTLPASVTSIGYNGFASCTSMKNLQIAGVVEIADYAFDNCTSLTEIEIPSTVTSIASHSFWRCTNLDMIRIHKFTGSVNNAPWGATSASIVWDGYDQSRIAVVVLDSNYNDTGSVTYYTDISNAITAIKNGSSSLYGLYVGTNSGATTIPSGAFASTTKLGRFVQGSVTDIGGGAFFRNTNLKYIDLSDGLLSVGDGAFNSAIMTELNVPNSVTTWGNSVIQSCAALQEFIIPICVTEIKSSEFYQCNSLESVTITENVTTIKQNAFIGTPALKELFIPSNVVTIENGAFFSTLETITIDKPENSISGAPWGATNATVIWAG